MCGYIDVKKLLISVECIELTLEYSLCSALIFLYILVHLFILYWCIVKEIILSSEFSENNWFPGFKVKFRGQKFLSSTNKFNRYTCLNKSLKFTLQFTIFCLLCMYKFCYANENVYLRIAKTVTIDILSWKN